MRAVTSLLFKGRLEFLRGAFYPLALARVQDSNQSLDPTRLDLHNTNPEVSTSASQKDRIPGPNQQILHRAAVQLLLTLGFPGDILSLLSNAAQLCFPFMPMVFSLCPIALRVRVGRQWDEVEYRAEYEVQPALTALGLDSL